MENQNITFKRTTHARTYRVFDTRAGPPHPFPRPTNEMRIERMWWTIAHTTSPFTVSKLVKFVATVDNNEPTIVACIIH